MSDSDRGEWEIRTAERNAVNWDDYAAGMRWDVSPYAPSEDDDADDGDAMPYECPDCGARHDGATTGAERLKRRRERMNLVQAQQAVERARDAYAAATSARAELVRRERDRGRTIYAIAQELGVTQNAVRRMLGLRGD